MWKPIKIKPNDQSAVGKELKLKSGLIDGGGINVLLKNNLEDLLRPFDEVSDK